MRRIGGCVVIAWGLIGCGPGTSAPTELAEGGGTDVVSSAATVPAPPPPDGFDPAYPIPVRGQVAPCTAASPDGQLALWGWRDGSAYYMDCAVATIHAPRVGPVGAAGAICEQGGYRFRGYTATKIATGASYILACQTP